MNRRSVLVLVAVGLVLGFGQRPAHAGLVTWDFGGEIRDIVDADGILGGAINVGTPFSGSFTFDSTTPDSDPENASLGVYDGAVTAVSGQIGDHTFFESDDFGSEIQVRSTISGEEDHDFGLFASDISFPDFNAVFDLSLFIKDFDGLTIRTDALPLFPPDLASSSPSMTFTLDPGRTAFVGELTALVPEPSSLALLAFGSLVLLKRRRYSRSLGVFGAKLFVGSAKRRRRHGDCRNGGRELVHCWMAWAEDRATVGTDPSADPGAKTEGLAACWSPVFPCSSGLA